VRYDHYSGRWTSKGEPLHTPCVYCETGTGALRTARLNLRLLCLRVRSERIMMHVEEQYEE
jgi:hypothetical protein